MVSPSATPTPVAAPEAGSDWIEAANIIGAAVGKAVANSGSPDWTDIISAIGTVTLGIGAFLVAWMQWRLEKQRFRHERFENRLKVHQSVHSFVNSIIHEVHVICNTNERVELPSIVRRVYFPADEAKLVSEVYFQSKLHSDIKFFIEEGKGILEDMLNKRNEYYEKCKEIFENNEKIKILNNYDPNQAQQMTIEFNQKYEEILGKDKPFEITNRHDGISSIQVNVMKLENKRLEEFSSKSAAILGRIREYMANQ